MNTMSYSAEQFAQRQAELAGDRQAKLDADPDVQTARRTLASAQSSLDHLQSYIKGRPVGERLQYNGNITEAKQVIRDAEKAVRTAENAHVRKLYLAQLEEKRQAQTQAQAARQDAMAEQIEVQAKTEYRISYLNAGGRASDFEAAWPGMWQAEVQKRTEQLTTARRELAHQQYAL